MKCELKFLTYERGKSELETIQIPSLSLITGQIATSNKRYLTGGWPNQNAITLHEDVLIPLGDSIFRTEETMLTSNNLDISYSSTGFTFGTDYYVYICDSTYGNNNTSRQ